MGKIIVTEPDTKVLILLLDRCAERYECRECFVKKECDHFWGKVSLAGDFPVGMTVYEMGEKGEYGRKKEYP